MTKNAPENSGERTKDEQKKSYVYISGRDDNGIKYEQAIEAPMIEPLTEESLQMLQEQAADIPGGFAGAMRMLDKITREHKPIRGEKAREAFLDKIEPIFTPAMLANGVLSYQRHKELEFIIELFGASGEVITSVYGKKASFIKREIKKAFYKGKTFEELENEYINAFLALPFETQQKAIDSNDMFILPGSMYEHLMMAWKAYIEKDNGIPAVKLREPFGVIMPLDKVTSAIANEKNPEKAEEITGSIHVESRKERESGKELETTYIIKRENKEISLSISKKDLFMIMMFDAIYVTALGDGIDKDEVKATPYELAKIIYKVERPGKHYIDDIIEAVRKNRNISVRIDNSKEAAERDKDTLDEEFYLLPCEIKRDGRIHILKRPVIVEEWIMNIMGEYTTITPDILCVPSVSVTDDNCAIILELLRSILGTFTPKDAKTGEKIISFSVLWENCAIPGKTQAERNQRTRLRNNTIIPCLKYWSAGNFANMTTAERKAARENKHDKRFLPEELRIIDGFRIDRNNIYITPRPENITGGKKTTSKK